MKDYQGVIYLDRELTFTQASKLNELFEMEHIGRPYQRMCLRITHDGKGIRWDGSRDAPKLEMVLADVMLLLDQNNIKAVGILNVSENNKRIYDIVVVKNHVKIFDGKIKNVLPARA